MWVSANGLPNHLSSTGYAEVISEAVGKGLVEVNRDCMGFLRMYLSTININS